MKFIHHILKRKILLIGCTIIVILLPIAFFLVRNAENVQAAWFDDAYGFRQVFSFTHNADITTDRAITFSLNTAQLIAVELMQDNCADTRFTDGNGKVLKYQLTGVCNNAATTYEIVFPSIANGLNYGYLYYGNASAVSGSQSVADITALTPSGGDPTITDRTNEQKGTTPVLYWKFDEGYGTTTHDATSYSNNGTLGASTAAPSWQAEDMCLFGGKCLKFDGSNDYVIRENDVDIELDPDSNSFTESTWFRHSSTISGSDYIISRFSEDGGYKIYMKSTGVVCFGIDAGSAFEPESEACSAVSYADSKWHFLTVVKNTTASIVVYVDSNEVGRNASIIPDSLTGAGNTLYIGIDSDGTSNSWDGYIDEVKIYNYAKSASQIKIDFANRGSNDQVGTSFGATDASSSLSNGLVGYWKMDESAANSCTGGTNDSCDSSGNTNNGAWNGNATNTIGKFVNGTTYDGNGDFTQVSANTSMNSASFSVGGWFKPGTLQTQGFITKNDTANSWRLLMRDNTGIIEFDAKSDSINLISSATISTGQWSHMFATFDADTKELNLYINGNPEPAITSTIDLGGASNTDIIIGATTSAGANPYNGAADDIHMYNRVLSKTEISSLYTWGPTPIGQWKFDEGTATTVNDSSSTNNTGTFSGAGPFWNVGMFGGAGKFNGVDNQVALTSQPAITSGFTFGAWVKRDADVVGNVFNNNQFFLRVSPEGENAANPFEAFVTLSDNNPEPRVTGTVGSTVGQWFYVTVTWDTVTLRLYVNGVLDGSTTRTGSLTATTATAQIGRGQLTTTTTNPWSGFIDDVKIYGYSRNSKQIFEDMNAGHPTVGTPVGSYRGYWNLDEGFGTTANDKSTNVNNLTLSASSWTNNAKFGKAFNGGDNLRLTGTDDIDFEPGTNEDFSISVWQKSDGATTGANEYLVSKVAAASAGYDIRFNTSGQVVCEIDDDGTSFPEDSATTTTDYYDQTWHHIVCVRDIVGDKLNLYVDGKLVAQDTDLSATDAITNSAIFYVNDTNATDGTDEFLGDTDEVKFYRLGLSSNDVKIEYTQGKAEVFGATSTESDGTTASFASARESCIPGDTTTCNAPVGEWKLDENAGTSAQDTSGNDSIGTLTNNPTWTLGKSGSAINTNTSTAHINISDPADGHLDFGAASSFTYMSWVKSSNSTTSQVFIYKDFGGGAPGYRARLTTAGKGACGISDSVAGTDEVTGTNTIADGQWHHVACVVDGTAAVLSIYVDGVFDTSIPITHNGSHANATNFQISINSASTYLQGSIDTVRVYNYARNSPQIAWDFNRNAPIGFWKLDDCSGTTAFDSSVLSTGLAGGKNGTWSGASGSNTAAGTCTSGNTAHAWFNGAIGKFNNSLDFDATDDVVTITNTATVDLNIGLFNGFTMSAWIFPDSDGENDTGRIFDKGTNTYCRLGSESAGLATVSCQVDLTTDAEFSATTRVTIGQWNHVTFSWTNDSDDEVSIWVNGIQNTSTTTFAGDPAADTSNFFIGNNSAGSATFDGRIDQIQLFPFEMTQAQIKTLYNENAAVRFEPATGTP